MSSTRHSQADRSQHHSTVGAIPQLENPRIDGVNGSADNSFAFHTDCEKIHNAIMSRALILALTFAYGLATAQTNRPFIRW